MSVLVLNLDYAPLGVTGWRDAFRLFFQDKAEILEVHEDKYVHTVNTKYSMPSVIRLTKLVPFKLTGIRFNKTNVYFRDKGLCAYCGVFVNRNAATMDHVIPKSRGGRTNFRNCVTACYDCNHKKGDRNPEEAQMPLLFKPTEPKIKPISLKSNLKYTYESWEKWITLKP